MKNKLRDVHDRRIRQPRLERMEPERLKDNVGLISSSSADEAPSALNSKVTLKARFGPMGTRRMQFHCCTEFPGETRTLALQFPTV